MAQFDIPLTLEEPHVKGDKVRDAQWLLSGHNVFKIRTYFGDIDSDAGRGTMDAARQMKWLLGYQKRRCVPTFGQELFEYLTDKRKRTPAMVARAATRKRRPVGRSYPLGRQGRLLGSPFQGTHTRGNWQSDRAYDLGIPEGTPVLAIEDGVIGSRIGDFGGTGVLAGKRVYVANDGNEYYYAHLRALSVRAGQRVVAGQTIGESGSAVGVPHLHVACRTGAPRTMLLGGAVPAVTGGMKAIRGPKLPENWHEHAFVPEDETESA